MKKYEINQNTIAILPINNYQSKVIEEEREIIIEDIPFNIIKNSCAYFGSSYDGRHKGTKNLIGVTHKSPIIVEETKELIFFPTTSPRLDKCSWLNYKKLNAYFSRDNKTFITMNNGYHLELDISYGIIDNQILRASYLESILRKRKIN